MHSPQHKRPIFLGAIVAPLFPVLGLYVYSGSWPKSILDLKIIAFMYGLSLLGMFLVGLPLVFLLKWAKWFTWLNVLVVSIVAGIIYSQLLGIFLAEGFELRFLLVGSSFGLLAGIGFCVSVWPNKSLKADAVNGAA